MNQVDENINKDMVEIDLIDVDSLSFADDQTWLCTHPNDSGQKVDIVDWNLSCDWPIVEDNAYMKLESELYSLLDNIIKNDIHAPVDRHKFDSRTFVRPKRRPQRPSIQNMVDVVTASHLQSIPQHSAVTSTPHAANSTPNKYLTYNKYNAPISPMLRLKTFNVDVSTDNSALARDFATKRRSLVQDDDPQLEDVETTLVSDSSGRQSSEHAPPSRPINIDLSQPAHNLHNTFNKGLTNAMNDRSGSLNMFQSGESLMRMSPPSLVSSLHMESSGTFNPESLEGRRSLPQHDTGAPAGRESLAGRESIDPMLTSMTLSILDEKDMSTSFLSQTTYPDHDSLMDSLPPSLVSSVNSSFVVPNTKQRSDSQTESNIFSSATFTHLEHSERLLSSRPRCQLFNSITKRDGIGPSESYTKSREEGCQIETHTKDAPTQINNTGSMGETITLHYSNVKFKGDEAEKENFNSTFEKDDAFYREMGMQKATDLGKNSLNVTLDKQELNEIIQARQKLSLARKALPSEEKTPIPNQADPSPIKTIQLPNQTITVPRHSMENASELLSRRRAQNGYEKTDEAPNVKRCATFKKLTPPKITAMDKTVVYVKPEDVIDINSATMNLIDTAETTLRQEEWCTQERAMVGSSESTDTGTFSSSSPPESVPASMDLRANQVASTPLTAIRKGTRDDLLALQNTISPILDASDSPQSETADRDHNATVVNSATMVKKSAAKRDILAGTVSPERRTPALSLGSHSNLREPGGMAPPSIFPKKPTSGLPTSKLRQYSSHKELNRIPAGPMGMPSRLPAGRGAMTRRSVYASNPVLSPPSGTAPALPVRRESYTVTQVDAAEEREKASPAPAPTPALVRQGTETLRRDRPPSQLVAPRDLRAGPGTVVVHNALPAPAQRAIIPPSASRGYGALPTTQMRVTRPSSGPTRPAQVTTASEIRPMSSNNEPRVSALPRPSRLPAPRRGLRPPSVYSVAPTADIDHY